MTAPSVHTTRDPYEHAQGRTVKIRFPHSNADHLEHLTEDQARALQAELDAHLGPHPTITKEPDTTAVHSETTHWNTHDTLCPSCQCGWASEGGYHGSPDLVLDLAHRDYLAHVKEVTA